MDGKTVNPLLFLVNEKIAVVSCFPEIVTLLIEIFGGDPRCLKLYSVLIIYIFYSHFISLIYLNLLLI